MVRRLLLADAELVATMDDGAGEIKGGSVLVEGGRILAVGRELEAAGAERIDLAGCVLLPGLVNTHHHFYQTLTRAVPAAQDADLFRWLETLYPIWARLTPEMLRVSTTTAMLELLLSGCTTTSDHHYVFPAGVTLDDSLEAAAALGMRFHATRGAMSVGRSRGGLPPDELVEDEDAILADMARVVDRWHDPAEGALLRVGLAPCSPFSVSRQLMRDTAALARDRKVMLHTHLAENASDVAYSREKFGCTPAEYAAELGWLGPDVWHAHCVQLDEPGIAAFARTRTGVAHCPCSNMRLGSGIAPVRAMRDAGVPVGLGVDGSASSDASHLLAEARQALLLSRVGGEGAGLSARAVLRLATAGGAAVLGRDDIGSIAPGKEADLAAFRIDGIAHAGALHDPLAALVFGQPGSAWYTIVKGRALVAEGRPTSIDLVAHLRHHNALARSLVD